MSRASRIGTWRTNSFWPTRCTRRSSMKVSLRTNTLSPRRRNRASTFRIFTGVAAAARPTPCRHSLPSAPTAGPNAPVSTTRRSATNSIRPIYRGAFTPASIKIRSAAYGRDIKPCATFSAVRTGIKISSRRKAGSSPTSRPGTLQALPGSRRSARTPTIPIAAAEEGPRGSLRSSTPSARASFGIRR